MIALFDLEKRFVGFSQDDLPFPNLLKKKISQEQQDLQNWKWVGDYDTGQMERIDFSNNQSTLTDPEVEDPELEQRKNALKQIFSKYPLEIQILYTMQQLYNIVKNSDSANHNFLDMVEEIVNTIEKYKIPLK